VRSASRARGRDSLGIKGPSLECAEGLSPQARVVFDAVAPHLPVQEGTVEDFVRSIMRPMVMDGVMTRRDAREAVEEGRPCLTLVVER
jgi:hypothetical protein